MLLRLWRTFRIFFLMVLFLALSLFLVITTPWTRWFGTPPTYAAIAAQGRPLVAAIVRFHEEHDLWPEYLDDLYPHYLSVRADPAWYYRVGAEGPTLSTRTRERRTHVGYDFDAVHPAWRVFGEVDNRVLSTAYPAATASAPFAAEVVLGNELEELDRRIAREPSLIEHRRGKASLLRSLGRLEEARGVLFQACADLPQAAWPQLALASLELTPHSVKIFAEWSHEHAGFTHVYDLSLLHRQLGDQAAALVDLRAALKFPARIAEDDPQTLAFYLWDIGRFALRQGDEELVLQIADVWDRGRAEGRVGENSIAPLRAAAELARKEDTAAAATMQTFEAHPVPTWGVHLLELRGAIAAHDHAFRYDPGPLPTAYEIFALPQ